MYNFNPRSPYGERLDMAKATYSYKRFQSTLPLRGATQHHLQHKGQQNISIHAPLTGSDGLSLFFLEVIMISIHAPLTGSDSGILLPG